MASALSPVKSKKKFGEKSFLEKTFPFQLLLPALILLLMIQVYPTLYTFNLSFNKIAGGELTPVGFENFTRLFNSSDFADALQKTAIYAIGYLSLVLILAMGIALLLNQGSRLTPLYITLLFVPWVLSEVVSGTMWRWLFQQDYGILQVAINPLVNQKSLLSDSTGAMVIVIASSVWRALPFNSLLLLGALRTVPNEIKEAGSLDGASRWQSFWQITIPIISPTLLVVILLTSIGAINQLGLTLATTNGGPGSATTTASVLLYREAFKYGDFGTAATLSVVMFIINLSLTLIYFRVVKVEA